MEVLVVKRDWGGPSRKCPDAFGRLRCSKCRTWKHPEEFSRNKKQTTGVNYACKECMRPKTRKYNLFAKYGISEQAYLAMVAKQGGKCACCGREFVDGRHSTRACVDHNHTTGEVRDVLCGRCNIAAGNLSDRSDLAERLVAYLKKWNC